MVVVVVVDGGVVVTLERAWGDMRPRAASLSPARKRFGRVKMIGRVNT